MNKLLTIAIAITLQLCVVITTHANTTTPDTYPFTSTVDEARFDTLTKEIRCVVCQNQSIADSNAPLANDLRGKIYQMVIEKKSDSEIKNFLVQRYGEFILLKPRLNKLTAFLWIFPFFGLFVIFLCLFRFIKQQKKTQST